LVGRYGLRFYNESFSERDTTFYTIGPRVQLRATSWVTFTLDYLYERGLADGRNEPQFKDDVSYWQNFVSFGTVFQLTQPLSLELIYVYRQKHFTTDIPGDPLRGDVDNLHQGTVEVHYDLSPAARVTLGYQRTQRSSDVGSRNFFNDNTSLGVQYRF
jgi:predicted porin